MSRFSSPHHGRKSLAERQRSRPQVELLEDRAMPSATTISGFVFADANNDGFYQTASEAPLQGSQIQLFNNSNGQLAGTATTDVNGYYSFSADQSLPPQSLTLSEPVTIPLTKTNWNQPIVIPQFNPALGTLTSITIQNSGAIISDIMAENTSQTSTDILSGTVSGDLILKDAYGNVLDDLNIAGNAGTFNAAQNPNPDGAPPSFTGPNAIDFGPKTVSGSDTITVSNSSMAMFKGTGNITLSEIAKATSVASDTNGNISSSIQSKATATIIVTYNYTVPASLTTGNYTIKQVTIPNSYFPGKVSSNGNLVPSTPNLPEVIPVTLVGGNSPHNDFGELQAASLSGHAYFDANRDGKFDFGDSGISGVAITLNGPNGLTQTTSTDGNGAYSFTNLVPGTYSVTETLPAGYLLGTDNVGTINGSAGTGTVSYGTVNEQISTITLNSAATGQNYDFGQLKPASLAGTVYYDANHDGQFNFGDSGISGVQITITGPGGITQTTTSDGNGNYSFINLNPGTYSVSEVLPASYQLGTDNVGTINGTPGSGTVVNGPSVEQITNITLNSADTAQSYNFGQLKPGSFAGTVYFDANNNGQFDFGDTGISGVQITLSGPGNFTQTITTDSNGNYSFVNLNPGTYSVSEVLPAGYWLRTDNVGTINNAQGTGTVLNSANVEQITNITLGTGAKAQGYNFGQLLPSSLAGNVYLDAQNDGHLDPGDPPIAGTTITLTGFTDQGPVRLHTTTNSFGAYSFGNLRPGTYALTETPPAGYQDGNVTVGQNGNSTLSLNGTQGTEVISAINLSAGVNGINNNFGELLPDKPGPKGTPNTPLNLPLGNMPVINKMQLEMGGSTRYFPPALRAQMAFVAGAMETLLGYTPNLSQLGAAMVQVQSQGQASYINQLWNSGTHRAMQVNSLYASLLHRAPTAQELASGITSLQMGMGVLSLESTLLVSQEYQQLHPTATGLATALAGDILNVVPGTTTTASLLQSMGVEPLSTVVNNLLYSSASLAKFVDLTFRQTLYRPATAMEIQTWSSQLQFGMVTLDGLGQRLLVTQEFQQLALNAMH